MLGSRPCPTPGELRGSSQHDRVGVVGVGAIGAAVVEALLTGPQAEHIEVVLSPRSGARSRTLVDRFDRARIADDNQGVLDVCDVVFVGVLPGQVREVCAELAFRADHVVVGLAAGWPPSLLTTLVAPAAEVCQLIPLPVITLHTGPIVLHPSLPVVEELLDGCGTLVVLEHEHDVIALSCASATMSTFFALLQTVVAWTASKGLPIEVAQDYATALFAGLALEAAAIPAAGLAAAPVEHETPGGLNEQVRLALTAQGTFDELRQQLDDMHAQRMQTSPS